MDSFILKFNDGVAVVLIAEVGFYREILFSIWKFRETALSSSGIELKY